MLQNNLIGEDQIGALLPKLSFDNMRALECWHQLGGLDWSAFTIWAELYDVDDPEGVLDRLIVIRDGLKTHAADQPH